MCIFLIGRIASREFIFAGHYNYTILNFFVYYFIINDINIIKINFWIIEFISNIIKERVSNRIWKRENYCPGGGISWKDLAKWNKKWYYKRSWSGNKIFYRDFATRDSGSTISLFQKLWHLSYNDTWKKIIDDLHSNNNNHQIMILEKWLILWLKWDNIGGVYNGYIWS